MGACLATNKGNGSAPAPSTNLGTSATETKACSTDRMSWERPENALSNWREATADGANHVIESAGGPLDLGSFPGAQVPQNATRVRIYFMTSECKEQVVHAVSYSVPLQQEPIVVTWSSPRSMASTLVCNAKSGEIIQRGTDTMSSSSSAQQLGAIHSNVGPKVTVLPTSCLGFCPPQCVWGTSVGPPQTKSHVSEA